MHYNDLLIDEENSTPTIVVLYTSIIQKTSETCSVFYIIFVKTRRQYCNRTMGILYISSFYRKSLFMNLFRVKSCLVDQICIIPSKLFEIFFVNFIFLESITNCLYLTPLIKQNQEVDLYFASSYKL